MTRSASDLPANLLEEAAERLKTEYGPRWHGRIEHNLKWLEDEMEVAPGSIAVEEGLFALRLGLPAPLVPPNKDAFKQ